MDVTGHAPKFGGAQTFEIHPRLAPHSEFSYNEYLSWLNKGRGEITPHGTNGVCINPRFWGSEKEVASGVGHIKAYTTALLSVLYIGNGDSNTILLCF